MRKRFYGALVLGSFLLAGGVVTSCSDYDDDINNLNQRVDAVEKTLNDLKAAIEKGVTINDIATTDNGIVIKTSKGDFTIINGTSQAGCTVKIGPNGTWVINGKDTGKPSKGADGEDGKDGIYYEPNAETNTWWKVEGDKKTDTGVSYLAEGTITAVYDKVNGELLLNGVEGYQGTLVISLTTGLKSLVFQPDFYYQGIEAMSVGTYNYTEKTVAKVNADNDFSKDAPTSLKGVAMSPGLVANYHMNPSNADINKIEKLSFISDDKDYTRSEGGVVKATVTSKEAKDGILTVHAQLTDGTIKDINTDGKVTVLALQANYKNAEEKVDTTITSDYAAVKAVDYNDMVLAHADATVDHTKHLYATAAEAIKNEAEYEIVWNHEGMDVAELVQTHYDDLSSGTSVHEAWDVNAKSGTVEKYGFEYSYELVGYHKGENKTSESAHAAMKGSVLRPQMPKDGKQQAFGAEQNQAEVNREPLVRVILRDKVSNKIASVGYIKFKIVDQAAESSVLLNAQFQFNDKYTVNCTENEHKLEIAWHDFEEDILAKLQELGISKEDFHTNFKLEGGNDDATQYDGVTATSQPATKKGIVKQTISDTGAEQTEIITWTLKNNEAYQLFKNNEAASVVVRYAKEIDATKHIYQYVYVTLTWTPSERNVTPAGKLADSDKIKEYWYATNKPTAGSGYSDIHANVETVGQIGANDEFKSDILNTFVGNDVTVSDVNSVYTAFQNDKLTKEFKFVDPQGTDLTPVTGNSGTQYEITVGKNGTVLYANIKGDLNKYEVVRLINQETPAAGKTIQQSVLEYVDNDVAKDILNYADHKDLDVKETFTAQLEIKPTNCDWVPFTLDNNKFFVKFLRPISIIDPNDNTFTDAETGGAKRDLTLKFVDWRDHNFDGTETKGHNYYEYYGVNKIECLEKDIKTDLNGTSGKFDKLLSSVTDKIKFHFTEPTYQEIQQGKNGIKHYFGTLLYENNGVTVGDFQIQVPFDVTYDWGTIRVYVVCKISKTQAN